MKDLTKEWFRKAEKDAATATRESSVEIDPNWGAVGFHAQQSVEKYIKGLLQEMGIPFSRTHDLSVSLNLLLPSHPGLGTFVDDVEWLSAFTVEFPYPGEEAIEEDARRALRIMKRILLALKEIVSRT